MTEKIHHRETEHQQKNSNSNAYLVPLSIILAALIISASIMFSFNSFKTNLAALPTQTGGSVQAAAPSAPTPVPSAAAAPARPTGTIKMVDAIKDAAAVRGDPNAPIVVIEFSDYQCPFCRRFFEDTSLQLKSQYVDTGKVLFAYKDLPLSFHPGAQPFAEAARCAGDQGKYWEYHDKIFSEQAKGGQGTIPFAGNDALKQWAGDLGVDSTAFNSCLDSGKYKSVVQSNSNDAVLVGASGTPSFYIGKKDGTGTLLVGAQPFSAFQAAINALN